MNRINRRQFIRHTTMASILTAVTPPLFALNNGNKLPAIGFISGIVNNFLQEDWKGTLSTLAAIGYTEIEGGWNLGESPKEMLDFCTGIGIRPVAGGLGLQQLLENTASHIETAKQCENDYLVCYWPWLDGADNITAEQCRKSADILNQMGELCKSSGLKFCWHNHDKEFLKDTGEGLPFDLLMKWTDPSLVSVELDLYWVKKGGGEPLSVMKKYPGRYSILHLKDMNNEEEMDFACPGAGVIDFAPLLREALDQGIQHYMVERDGEVNGLNCLQNSYHYLRELSL
jgi:sugar phosphate isomerase/epimerase